MAQYPANINLFSLNGTNGFHLADDGAAYGASAGDVNGDGFDDMVLGRQGYVVFGNATGPFSLNLDGSNGFKINGGGGKSVASAGDVNGDGLADVIVARFDEKASYVVFGRPEGFAASFNVASVNGLNGFKLNGAGTSVASAGDVNRDGFDDVIVGAGSQSYVVFGKASGFAANINLATLNGINGFKISGAGSSVASAGDINGDGFADMILGVPNATPHGSQSGETYVVFGKASGFGSNINVSKSRWYDRLQAQWRNRT